jgi:uncharacterized protein (TIGR02246 family)
MAIPGWQDEAGQPFMAFLRAGNAHGTADLRARRCLGLFLSSTIPAASKKGDRVMDETSSITVALAAIAELHARDMAASKAQDFATLRTLMSDDAVAMPPGSPFIRGRAALDAGVDGTQLAMQTSEVLEYVLDFEEVVVLGEYAFEWGTIRGAMRAAGSDAIERSAYKVMRILQRQPDGQWKVHRTIWNDLPLE